MSMLRRFASTVRSKITEDGMVVAITATGAGAALATFVYIDCPDPYPIGLNRRCPGVHETAAFVVGGVVSRLGIAAVRTVRKYGQRKLAVRIAAASAAGLIGYGAGRLANPTPPPID